MSTADLQAAAGASVRTDFACMHAIDDDVASSAPPGIDGGRGSRVCGPLRYVCRRDVCYTTANSTSARCTGHHHLRRPTETEEMRGTSRLDTDPYEDTWLLQFPPLLSDIVCTTYPLWRVHTCRDLARSKRCTEALFVPDTIGPPVVKSPSSDDGTEARWDSFSDCTAIYILLVVLLGSWNTTLRLCMQRSEDGRSRLE